MPLKLVKPKLPMKKHIADANKSVGRIVTPKKDTAKGKVLTQDEARKEQLKKNKKSIKGGYSGANKV